MKKIKEILSAGAAVLIMGAVSINGSADDLVASADEMVEAADIVTDDMVPIYADSLKDGIYSIEVLSSSSMFKIYDCQLTVADGEMSAVLTIDSDSYLKLFMGTGAEAIESPEEEYISFELDENGRQTYQVPVEALDSGIDCAAWSKRKEKWYDRTLVFSSSSLSIDAYQKDYILTAGQMGLEDGTYTAEVKLSGGSGKTTVESPVTLTVKDGQVNTKITFSSSNYNYVLVSDEKYEQINSEGNSSFEIPVTGFDWEMPIKANSTAMGLSHEIDYTLYFDSSTIQNIDEAAITDTAGAESGAEESASDVNDIETVSNSQNYTDVLADGSYKPDKFSWTGGSGKVELSCNEIIIRDGKSYAVIIFDSSSYSYVTAGGVQYEGSYEGDSAAFEIPVQLNANNTITGMTTKMSAAHEITYEFYIYLEAAEAFVQDSDLLSISEFEHNTASSAADNKSGQNTDPAVDTEAPAIAGLTFESETKLEHAKNIRIYHYNDGIILLDAPADRYLVVPKGVEIPVGLEKEMTIIQAPAEAIYTVSVADPDFKEIIRSGYDLAIFPQTILDGMDADDAEQIISGFETLGIPVFIDEAASEDTEEAVDEWEKVYAILSYDAFSMTTAATEAASSEADETMHPAEETDTLYLTEPTDAPDLAGLSCTGQLKLDFAEGYDVYFYENNYALINIYDSGSYLLVPEGVQAPEELDEGITLLQQPLNKIYLPATSAMALFRALDSLDKVRMTGTQANGWYIEEAAERLESGEMLFAGKYSEPDYELLLDEGCDIAIESTMILHTPKVQEMLEMLGIPVLIERASYETHPLGRTEWIKLYGVLMDKELEAYEYFEEQKKIIDDLSDFENTEKTVAFFYVNTDGTIVVRRNTDYIPNMITIAGGRYVYQEDWQPGKEGSSVYLTMEEFYAAAHDADYLVYNATIAEELTSMDELLAQNELFADFKAVREENVWTTGKYLFQATDIVGQLITDFHQMITGENLDQMTFLTQVK